MEIESFEHEDFGTIRTMLVDGQPFFVGDDVAEVLGYRNSRKAIMDNVDSEDKIDGATIRNSIDGNQTPTLINESGVYSLLFSSHLPTAKQFKRWVMSEVLPSLRRHAAEEPLPETSTNSRILPLERETEEAEENAQPSGLKKKKIQVGCYLDPETHRRLGILARMKGTSVGEILCNAGIEITKKYRTTCDEAEAILRKFDAQELKIQ